MDYKNEVKNRFGNTAEYKEYEKKSLSRTNEKEAELSKGLNRYLREEGLSQVDSALQLFDLADKSFCPSIPELEPIKKEKLFFCGTLKGKRE